MRTWTFVLLFGLACLPPCTDSARVERAEVALKSGDLTAAEADFRAVVDGDPDNVDALYGLGWTYLQSGQGDRAREYFKRCVRLAPRDYRGHRGLGAADLADGNPMLARLHLTEALTLAPQEPRIHNSIGLAHLSENNEEDALSRFEQAVELDPTQGEYGYNRADVLLRLGELDLALEGVDAALSGDIDESRFRPLLLDLRARILIEKTAGRVDPERCEETATPVLAWLAAAERALDQAEAESPTPEIFSGTRRRGHRRRSVITEQCPGVQ
ncbi:MAG: tetratricopeptide repeat protein [Proteobacteria bacterium]|nr:tetratricopeptide repeat protein [Pseudomonadota bacterium]MCP4917688.1 tetratricopeptide repeat protein [Pseudomonadota bacterium]